MAEKVRYTFLTVLLPVYSLWTLLHFLETTGPGAHEPKYKNEVQTDHELKFWAWISFDMVLVQTFTTIKLFSIWHGLTSCSRCHDVIWNWRWWTIPSENWSELWNEVDRYNPTAAQFAQGKLSIHDPSIKEQRKRNDSSKSMAYCSWAGSL